MENKKTNAVKDVIKELNKKYGKEAVVEGEGMVVEAIPTECMSLDWVLGCGGFPRGRIMELYGQESSGKSTMALFFAAQIQKQGGTVVWVDAEQSFDSNYAKKIGVNTKDLIVNRPMSGEEAFNVLEKMIKTNSIDLIVVDSVSALVPQKELDGQVEDVTIALQARLMSKGLRMITGGLARTKTSVIFINQLRDKIGVVYGVPTTTTGGKALKFYASIRLSVRKGSKILNSSKDVIGNVLKIKGEKNKVGLPFRETELELFFNKGLDIVGDTLNFAISNKVVKKDGITYSYKKIKLGVGKDKSKKYLEENEEVLKSIKEDLVKLTSTPSDVPVEVK